MSPVSNEWWEYHLTPEGWVNGDYKLDMGRVVTSPTPENRLLTICETQIIPYFGQSIDTVWSVTFNCGDKELIQKFLHQYGLHRFEGDIFGQMK